MFHVILALSIGMIIGWNLHLFMTSETALTPLPIAVKSLPTPLPLEKIVHLKKKPIIEEVLKEENTSTISLYTPNSFSELLMADLFSDAMALYIDGSETQRSFYRVTLLNYFKKEIEEDFEQTMGEMIEFQEIEEEDSRVDLTRLEEMGDNEEEKAYFLLNLIEEKLMGNKEYSYQIPLKKVGEHFTMDVFVEDIPLRLLLDTGASLTLVKKEKLSIGLKVINSNIRLNTAGGKITAKLLEASTLSIDIPNREERLILNDFQLVSSSFKDHNVDGLLGMNFFKQFKFKLDQEAAMLYLSKIEE